MCHNGTSIMDVRTHDFVHTRFGSRRQSLSQPCFNLSELEALALHLNLRVLAANKDDITALGLTNQITCFEHAPGIRTNGYVHKRGIGLGLIT
nr:hypothetical protein [Trichoderma harzianum]